MEIEFSKQEKKIIKFILNQKNNRKNTIELIFKDIFEDILGVYYKDIGIKISENKFYIIFDKDELKKKEQFKERIYELVNLIKKLKETKYILFEKSEVSEFQQKFEFSLVQKNIKETKCDFINSKDIKELLNILGCNFFIGSELIRMKRRFLWINFLLTNDQLNFWIAIITTIISILVAIAGFYVDYHIANNISTTVVFKNDEQFEKLISPKQVNVKNENNIIIPENFYKPKTELKLEVFK